MAKKQNSGDESEPRGDLGENGKTWTPDPGEQGISNRPDDEEVVGRAGEGDDEDDEFAEDDEDDGLDEESGDSTRE